MPITMPLITVDNQKYITLVSDLWTEVLLDLNCEYSVMVQEFDTLLMENREGDMVMVDRTEPMSMEEAVRWGLGVVEQKRNPKQTRRRW